MPYGRKPPGRAANVKQFSIDEVVGLNNDTGHDIAPGCEIDVSRMDDLHMNAWFGMAFRYPPNILKLIWDLCQWMADYGSLVATLIFGGIFDQNYANIRWTIVTHILSCIVMLIIEWTGQKRRTRQTIELMFKFLANVFMILKPIRYITGYRYRKEASKLVRDKFKLRKELTEEEINVVIKINERELEDNYYNLIFVFLQSVPLCLLQLHILFSSQQKFQLCSQADFSRLLMILSTIFSIAKSTVDYSWNYNLYIQSLHFLDYYKSNFRHEMNVISIPNRFTFSFHLLCNWLLALHRLYCISFFLSVSQVLCAVYACAIFLSQWLMLILCPDLRPCLENAPVGVHSFSSELFDRWVNVFTLHMMNWNRLSRRSYRLLCKFRLPLALLHLIPFAAAMLAVFLVTYTMGGRKEHVEILRSVIPALRPSSSGNSSDTETLIPCTESRYQTNIRWMQSAGNFLLAAHHKVTNRFVSFNDLFGVLHFLPFSMYAYLCAAFTFSYYLHWFLLDDAKFPAQLAYCHWSRLLRLRDYTTCRKLLVLTLLPPQAFQRAKWKERLCACANLERYYSHLFRTNFQFPQQDPAWWSQEVDKLILCSESPKVIREFYDFLLNNSPKEELVMNQQLVWLLCRRFHYQMGGMSSERIKCTEDMCRLRDSSSLCYTSSGGQ